MDDGRGWFLFGNRGRMIRNYIHNVTKALPHIITMGQQGTFVEDEQTARWYGLYEYTGWRGFWRKLRITIKLYHGGRG